MVIEPSVFELLSVTVAVNISEDVLLPKSCLYHLTQRGHMSNIYIRQHVTALYQVNASISTYTLTLISKTQLIKNRTDSPHRCTGEILFPLKVVSTDI